MNETDTFKKDIYGSAKASFPAQINAVLLVALPLVVITIYSFSKRGDFGSGIAGGFTLEAYKNILFETSLTGEQSLNFSYLAIIARSIVLAAAVAILCLVVGLPTAVWIALQSKSKQRILILLITIPFWVNVLARTYAWMLLLNENGLLNELGLPPLLYTNWATLIGLVYAFLPFMVLPIYAAAEKLNKNILEAAFDLGANGFKVLFKIVFPMIRLGIYSGVTIVFVPALGAYVQPSLLGGNKSMLIGSLINDQFGESRNWPLGSALGVLLLVLTVFSLFVVQRRSGKS